ncbi:unnamed protein product [marine sediment metagenome]|uniref:Uncharacterized protein n=1 Tax=marine sediment metagenome TaxID=412755 RepID=X1V7U8_9ZZZZ
MVSMQLMWLYLFLGKVQTSGQEDIISAVYLPQELRPNTPQLTEVIGESVV